MGEAAAVERLEQRGVVDQAAAAGVDQPRARAAAGRGGAASSRFSVAGVPGSRVTRMSAARAPRRGRPRRRGSAMPGELARAAAPAAGRRSRGGRAWRRRRGRSRRGRAGRRERSRRERRDDAVAPDAVLAERGGVDAEVVAQHVAGDPFRHAAGRPGSTMRQSGTARVGADDVLDAGPEAEHRLEAGEGREVGDRAAGAVDDIVEGPGARRDRRSTRRRAPRRRRRRADAGARAANVGRGGEEGARSQGAQSRLRGRWTWALCTRPKAASSTIIAVPP